MSANIGAGTIFANYDGVAKHHTGGCAPFVGSDTVLIAPVNIADGAYVGAGSAVTADVAPGQDRGGRRQRNIAGWVSRRRAGTKTAEAGSRRPAAARPRQTTAGEADELRPGSSRPPRRTSWSSRAAPPPELAGEVAWMLGVELVPTSAYDFANGEIYVRYEESVRGSTPSSSRATPPLNEAIMEQLIMIDALKRASAKRITVVLPFYGYARQDKKHRGREPISARLMADLFKTAGADRLMAVDLHTAQIRGFFDGPVDHLMALPILTDHVEEVRRRAPGGRLAGRRTDQGGRAVVRPARRRAAGLHPQDPRHQPPNEAVANRVVGEVQGGSASWSTT